LTYDGTLLDVTGNVDISSNLTANNITADSSIYTPNFRELYSDLGSGGSKTIDLSTANNFKYTATSNVTYTFSNPPTAPQGFGFTLVYVNGGNFTTTWPAGVQWAGGIAPALTANGTDILVFYTYDTGTTYYGFLSAANLS
jgi:hypothetical protein